MHPRTEDIRGLYAIADTATIAEDLFFEKVGLVIAAGCSVLQYRDKSSDPLNRLKQAVKLQKLCKTTGTVFIINDDPELAMQVDADGVHCGRNDAAVSEIRAGYPNLLIGASCYNSLQRASEAVAAGADYVAFGRFFPSATKPEAVPADTVILQQSKQQLQKPVVAIGGIMAENA